MFTLHPGIYQKQFVKTLFTKTNCFLMTYHQNLTDLSKELGIQKDLNAKQLPRQINSSRVAIILAT